MKWILILSHYVKEFQEFAIDSLIFIRVWLMRTQVISKINLKTILTGYLLLFFYFVKKENQLCCEGNEKEKYRKYFFCIM